MQCSSVISGIDDFTNISLFITQGGKVVTRKYTISLWFPAEGWNGTKTNLYLMSVQLIFYENALKQIRKKNTQKLCKQMQNRKIKIQSYFHIKNQLATLQVEEVIQQDPVLHIKSERYFCTMFRGRITLIKVCDKIQIIEYYI